MRIFGSVIGILAVLFVILAFGPPLQTLVQGSIHGPNSIGPSPTALSKVLPGDVKQGQAVYQAKCIGCHSAEAKVALPHHGEALFGKYKTAEAISQVLRSGRHPMPQFTPASLSDQQLADVIAYMKTLP